MKILLFTIISVLIVAVSVTSISAQSQYEIPSWIKGIAGYWAEDKISDSDFGEGLSFLIDNELIKVPLIQELQNENAQLKAENYKLRSQLNLPTSESEELQIIPLGKLTIDQEKLLLFTVELTDSSIMDAVFSLSNEPSGATINKDTGIFSWTPTTAQVGVHIFDFIAKSGSVEDKETITIIVNDKPLEESNVIISANTELNTYSNGAEVRIFGNIEPYDSSSGKGLTFIVTSPEGDDVGMGQLTPSSDGSFEKSIVAGGPLWKSNGEYVFQLQYGADSTKVVINFIGAE